MCQIPLMENKNIQMFKLIELNIARFPSHVFLEIVIPYPIRNVYFMFLERYASHNQYSQKLALHVFWRSLIPHSRFLKICQTDIRDCSAHPFPMNFDMFKITFPKTVRDCLFWFGVSWCLRS